MPTPLSRAARAAFTGAAAALALSSAAHAQVANAEYAARRKALAASIDSGVVVAFGAVEPVSYWPTFHQVPGFYYFTGFDETDAVLLMVKRGGGVASTIFVPTRTAIAERWLGARARPADLERPGSAFPAATSPSSRARWTRSPRPASRSTSSPTCRPRTTRRKIPSPGAPASWPSSGWPIPGWRPVRSTAPCATCGRGRAQPRSRSCARRWRSASAPTARR